MRRIFVLFCICTLVAPWVIYKRNHKRKLVCKEENDWGNTTAADELSELNGRRNRRDVVVDPELRQPIIFLGVKPNDSSFIDDGDFDVVSEFLTKSELEQVKKRIMETCNSLNAN